MSARAIVLAAALAISASGFAQNAVLLSGEVLARGAVPVVMPASNTSPTVIRYFVEEGATVKKGDVVLRTDPPSAASQATLEAQVEQTRARTDKEVADLRVLAISATIAVIDARSLAAKAALDAAVPKVHLSPLDFDRYQGEAERSTLDHQQKQSAAKAANDAVSRRIEDAALELQKAQIELTYAQALLARSEVRAAAGGVVIHGFNDWRGRRYDEGESANGGVTVGQIVNGSATFVRAYALEVDRLALKVGQAVTVEFDALPDLQLSSKIAAIASAPEPRAAWGDGRYFQVDIDIEEAAQGRLIVGMSARIEPRLDAAAAAATLAASAQQKPRPTLDLEGELIASRKSQIAPPAVKDVWQLTLQMLVPEGSMVDPTQVVATFDGATLMQQLQQKQGKLGETKSAIDKLQLEQAQAQREQALAVAFAISESEKAARKASQPATLIGGIAYQKLLIDKQASAERAELASALLKAQDSARLTLKREVQLIQSQLNGEISMLNLALASMQVKPSLSGMVIHNAGFNGDKFTSGSQVFFGLSVASVADMSSLQVNAWVPEAQSLNVRVGQQAEITLSGGARVLNGTVRSLGQVFRSKSRSQPIIVRDLSIALDAQPGAGAGAIDKSLKPGTAVRVRISP